MTKKISKSNNKKKKDEEDLSKTNYSVFNEYFKSPFKSLKKIKINKQIFNNMILITSSKQALEYNSLYEQVVQIKNRNFIINRY